MGSCIAGEPVPAVSLATVTRLMMSNSPFERKMEMNIFVGLDLPVESSSWILFYRFFVGFFSS